MKAFVTGATGFIGRRLVAALLEKGFDVTALVRPDRAKPDGLPLEVKRVFGKVEDPSALRHVEGFDVLFHLAGVYRLGETEPQAMERVNVGGTRNVLEAAADGRVERVVCVSSQIVLGPAEAGAVTEESPGDGRFRSEYERTKRLAHQAAVEAARRGVPVRIALPGPVYGPEDPSLLGDTLRKLARGRLPAAAFPDLVLSPVHVEDVVDGLIRIAESGRDGESYLLTGEPIAQAELLAQWAGLCGRRPPRFLPGWMPRLTGWLLHLVTPVLRGPAAFVQEVTAMSDGVRWAADSSRALRELGWQPRTLEAGLKSIAYEAAWPTHGKTWLHYFHVGRWNYFKGTCVAAAGAALIGLLWGLWPALIFFAGAPLYILMSGLGLYLLYGHPAGRYLDRLFRMAGLRGNERVADLHFGTYRGTRAALERLPGATVHAVEIADHDAPVEEVVTDVWQFERPPLGHPRLQVHKGTPDRLPLADGSIDVILLGFGIHEVQRGAERTALMAEIRRVLVPGGRVLLYERGWSPLLLLIFGLLFFHFTPAWEWEQWFRERFAEVRRRSAFGMVDLFVASGTGRGQVGS